MLNVDSIIFNWPKKWTISSGHQEMLILIESQLTSQTLDIDPQYQSYIIDLCQLSTYIIFYLYIFIY